MSDMRWIVLALDAAALSCATAAGWYSGSPVIGCSVTAGTLSLLSWRVSYHFD